MKPKTLSKNDRRALKEDAGATHATIVMWRGTDRLIRATATDGATRVEGWWYDGEGAADIKWKWL